MATWLASAGMKSLPTQQALLRQQLQVKLHKQRMALRQQNERLRQWQRKVSAKQPVGRRILPWLLLVVVMLLLWRRACVTRPTPPQDQIQQALPVQAPRLQLAPVKTIEKRIPTKRSSYPLAGQAPPQWLQVLQLQVAARAPQLALCLPSTKARGGLTWTCRIEPHLGLVSDQQLTSHHATLVLSPAAEQCMMDVLAKPAYQLTAGNEAEIARIVTFHLAW